jgi:hypothetical protein
MGETGGSARSRGDGEGIPAIQDHGTDAGLPEPWSAVNHPNMSRREVKATPLRSRLEILRSDPGPIRFAGNHADVGGNYSKNEFPLSDKRLGAMFIDRRLPIFSPAFHGTRAERRQALI